MATRALTPQGQVHFFIFEPLGLAGGTGRSGEGAGNAGAPRRLRRAGRRREGDAVAAAVVLERRPVPHAEVVAACVGRDAERLAPVAELPVVVRRLRGRAVLVLPCVGELVQQGREHLEHRPGEVHRVEVERPAHPEAIALEVLCRAADYAAQCREVGAGVSGPRWGRGIIRAPPGRRGARPWAGSDWLRCGAVLCEPGCAPSSRDLPPSRSAWSLPARGRARVR